MNLGEIIKKYKEQTFPFIHINKKTYKYSTSIQISSAKTEEKEIELVEMK